MSDVDAATLGFVGLLLAAIVVAVHVTRSRHGRHRRVWAQTMGTVLSSTVQVSNNGASRHETPLVLYAFQVGDQVYQGDKVCAEGRVAAASDVVTRYPAGANVVVHYDPTDPACSALEV